MKLIHSLAAVTMSIVPMFAQGGFGGPGRYQIRNVESQKPLDLNGNRVIQNSQRNSSSQIWEIQPAGPDVYYVRNAAAGCALEFTQDRNSAPVVCTNGNSDNQHWRFEPTGDGSYLIISRFRKPLDLPDGSRRDGQSLQIYDRNGDGNQRFFVDSVGGGGFGRFGRGDGFGNGRGDGRRGDDFRGDRTDPRGQYFDARDQMWRLQGDGVCFYRDTEFRGQAICARSGEDVADVRREGGGVFLSMKLFGRANDVEIFERNAFRGGVVRLRRDEANLRRVRAGWSGSVGDSIGSFRVN